jgi:hypothetical protein
MIDQRKEGRMVTTITAPTLDAKAKLQKYREAARSRSTSSWGDKEAAKQEALKVHRAYGQARKRANEAKHDK